ncbi:hypothetical protein ACFLYJ_01895 [Candidatus Cloacimonadota bacterium]
MVAVLIVMLSIIQLLAINEFACIFTTINTSVRGSAFGNNGGAADIWDTSPLGVWSNPAKLGYHKGVAYGYSNTPWMAEIFDDIVFRASYMSIGWNGIGILLPAPSQKEQWGTVFSYGEQIATDPNGNILDTFESWDANAKYAFGINIFEFSSKMLRQDFLCAINHFGEISLGYSYDDIQSKIAGGFSNGSFSNDVTLSDFQSYSFLGRLSPFNKTNTLGGFLTLDLVGGINYINPQKSEITYIAESGTDPLPWGTHSAFSGKISISQDIVPGLEIPPILDDFVDNLFTYYYSQDQMYYGKKTDDNPGEWGYGYEFTFLDIFSIRNGEYRDKMGEIMGDTYGFGINLNYKDIFQFQYNYAEIPGGELEYKRKMDDYLFRVDLLKLFAGKGE